MNIHINRRTVRLIIAIIGLVGLLAVAYGAFTALSVTTAYNALPVIEPPTDPKQAESMAMALAALDNQKNSLLEQRGQATTVIGIGAAILGATVILYLRLSEQVD